MVDRARTSGDGPASTQLNRKRMLIRDLAPAASAREDTRGTRRNRGIPAGLRRPRHVRDARRSADSRRPTLRRGRLSRRRGAIARRDPAAAPSRGDRAKRQAGGRGASRRNRERPCGRGSRRTGRIQPLASSRRRRAAPGPCAFGLPRWNLGRFTRIIFSVADAVTNCRGPVWPREIGLLAVVALAVALFGAPSAERSVLVPARRRGRSHRAGARGRGVLERPGRRRPARRAV